MMEALEISMDDNQTTALENPLSESVPSRPVLTIDYALYEEHLEGADLSDVQKQEFLDALWSIIVGFVDLGFGVHPLQQIPSDTCGQEVDLTSLMASDVISSSKGKSLKQFEKAADRHTGNRAGNIDL